MINTLLGGLSVILLFQWAIQQGFYELVVEGCILVVPFAGVILFPDEIGITYGNSNYHVLTTHRNYVSKYTSRDNANEEEVAAT